MRRKTVRKDYGVKCLTCGKAVHSLKGRKYCNSLCYLRYRRKKEKEKEIKED